MSRCNRLAACVSALLAGVSFCLARPAAAQYTLTNLGSDFNPIALNNKGQVLGLVGSSLYLTTNGVRQFVSDLVNNPLSSNSPKFYLNQKGQVAGMDAFGNLFLFTNGVKQTIISLYTGNLAGLNDSGELVWNAANQFTRKSDVYIYQNGVITDTGAHSAITINNAGQILGQGELYLNGVWQTPANFNDRSFLNNNGQVLTEKSFYYTYSGYPYNNFTYSIYDIAAGTNSIKVSLSVGPYINLPSVIAFNDEGDFIGTAYTGGPSSSNQSGWFGWIQGRYINTVPSGPTSFPNVHYGSAIALNNLGQTLSQDHSWISDSESLYDPKSDTSTLLGTVIFSNPKAYVTSKYLNDRGQMVISYGSNYLATPNALVPADSVSGFVRMENDAGYATAQTVTFAFRDAASGKTQFTRTALVSPYGAFTVGGVSAGSYNVWIKSPKNLAQVVALMKGGGAASGVSVVLPAGDANNDNSVDSSDLTALIGAFNSDATIPGSGYDPAADFNNDGSVDSSDFTLIIGNFGLVGAP